jgi:hypothetical protein
MMTGELLHPSFIQTVEWLQAALSTPFSPSNAVCVRNIDGAGQIHFLVFLSFVVLFSSKLIV